MSISYSRDEISTKALIGCPSSQCSFNANYPNNVEMQCIMKRPIIFKIQWITLAATVNMITSVNRCGSMVPVNQTDELPAKNTAILNAIIPGHKNISFQLVDLKILVKNISLEGYN